MKVKVQYQFPIPVRQKIHVMLALHHLEGMEIIFCHFKMVCKEYQHCINKQHDINRAIFGLEDDKNLTNPKELRIYHACVSGKQSYQ